MEEQSASRYLTVTSNDFMMNHEADDFNIMLSETRNNDDATGTDKKTAVIAEFKRCLLKHSKGETVINFIREYFKKTLVKRNFLSSEYNEEQENDPGQNIEDNALSADDLTDDEWFSCPFVAIDEKRLDILEMCFSAMPDTGSVFWKDGKNLLMHSVSQTDIQETIITFLVRYTDVNHQALGGATALSVCLKNIAISSTQKLWLTRYIVQERARSYTSGKSLIPELPIYINNLTSAGAYVDENWTEIIDALLSASPIIDEVDFVGQSALMAAVMCIPLPSMPDVHDSSALGIDQKIDITMAIVRYLLDKGADPNLADIHGNTSIHLASVSMNVDVLKLLIEYGGKPEVKNRIGMTAVYMICSEHGWTEEDEVEKDLLPILDVLINAGCDVNSKAMDMTTVLHYAAAKLPAKIVQLLCEHGADVSAMDYLRRTPLHMTSRNDNTGIVHCLSNFDANLNAGNINADTPLHIACLHDNLQVVTELIENGANVEAVGDLGIKPIHLAAENGSAELLKAVSESAELAAIDKWGATPLHYAAFEGNYETGEVLLELGVDKSAVDVNLKTPLDFALHRGNSLKTAQLLANSHASVRFGNLPPLYFPNRPVIKKEEVDEYFDGLIEAFEKDGTKGVDLAKGFLSSPGLGHVDLDKGESKLISEKIIMMMERTVQRIGKLDSVFEAKLLRAGSTLEDVKTGFPDEYDFLCHMDNFSKHIEKTEVSDANGFAKVIMKEDAPPEILEFCLRSNRVLNAAKFLRHFSTLAQRARYLILSEDNPQLYTGFTMLKDNATLYDPLFYQNTKLHGQSMSFRGEEFKFLDISVDINPVLYSPIFPKEFIQTCHLLGDISSRGIYLIPKHCSQLFTLTTDRVPQTADLWRYSTHHLEAAVMHNLPNIGRDCYIMCKLLRMEPMTCGVEYNRYEPMMLTEEQLQLLLPGGGGIAENDEDSDSDDATDDDIEEESVEGGEEENASLSGTSDGNERGDNSGGAADDDLDDYDALQSATFKDIDEDSKDEINAESSIPSYYLKSIFIKEAEELSKAGESFTEKSLTTIPLKVYRKLLEACNQGNLSTLFLPEQNMFKRVDKSREDLETEQMRVIYCKNIIRLQESLGFQ